jgi:hypothetical protein
MNRLEHTGLNWKPILRIGTVVLGLCVLGARPYGAGEGRMLLGHVAPRTSGGIEGSPWGIQIGSLDSSHIARAAGIGVKWTRLNCSWREVEKERGIYDWKKTDEAFSIALAEGITPFVCLAGSNPLYCRESIVTDDRERELYGSSLQPPTSSPEAKEAWLQFVRAAVGRYRDRIRYWEVWNEPNHRAYWGAQPDGHAYGLLLRETSHAIKSIDPDIRVIGGALAGLDPGFVDNFLAEGTAPLIDIISFHNYAATPEERIYKAVEVWSVIRRYNPDLLLWQGECGYPSHSSTRDYRGTSPWGVNIQAKWLLRQSFTDIYFCRTSLSNYFKLVHEGGRGDMPARSGLTALDSILGFPERGGFRVKSVGVNEKCILTNPDLDPKPAYFAYRNLCAVFDNRYTPLDCEPQITIRDQGIFSGIGGEDDAAPSIPLVAAFRTPLGHCFVAYWLPWHPQELIREAKIDLNAEGMTFRNPVLIDLLDGEVYSLHGETRPDGVPVFRNIPLADYPFAIAERDEIAIAE